MDAWWSEKAGFLPCLLTVKDFTGITLIYVSRHLQVGGPIIQTLLRDVASTPGTDSVP